MERRNIPCDRAYGRRKRTGEVIDEDNKILTVATARSANVRADTMYIIITDVRWLCALVIRGHRRRVLVLRVCDQG